MPCYAIHCTYAPIAMQDMLRAVPVALSESSRNHSSHVRVVSEIEEAKRLELRGMDKCHSEELATMKQQYETWRLQYESLQVEADHKNRQLESAMKEQCTQSEVQLLVLS